MLKPSLPGELWKLIDWFKDNKGRSQTRLAINSNLGMDRLRLFQFRDALKDIPHVEIYTSNEAYGDQAEYIRDGLDYELWMHNVQELLEHNHIRAVHFMCTINALCLDTLDVFLDQLIRLKKVYGRERVNFTLNILRFPSFQSALVLPVTLKAQYRNRLIDWLAKHRKHGYMHEHEINQAERLIDYLDQVKTPHSESFDMPQLLNDFKQFYTQYDLPMLKDWYNTL
jgi:hypothetical protein